VHTLINENRALVLAVGASVTAQLLKVLTHFMRTRKVVWSRAWGAGGLPSSHSAMVTALATALGYRYGFDSGLFAVAAVFSLIVLYDAMGIRQAVGHQGRLLNRMMRAGVLADGGQEPMAELVGHTFWEVLVGVMWGLLLVIIFY
jgi:acid phosphatase family membrane protein YuiD